MLVAGLVAGVGLLGVSVIYREPIRQVALGEYQWRMVMGPSVLTAEEEKKKAAEPGADQAFAECKKGCPVMVVVPACNPPACKFEMGSPENEEGRYASEGPQHPVTIARPFAVSKFVVTFEEWDACVAAAACPQAAAPWGRGKMPAINVSWEDAKQYVRWLSWLTGKEYRLLTEAEGEYSARAGTTTRYFWGDDIGKGNANCDGCGSEWDRKQTAPVDSFRPNAFGLFNMQGNVFQWVEDVWHHNYYGAPVDGSAWFEGGDSSRRVLRGGNWRYLPQALRAASRSADRPRLRIFSVGFRVARTLTP
jgi:formylglycine-generating enzyme required for sulfatase activity